MITFKHFSIFCVLISCNILFGQQSFEERLNSCFQSEKFNSSFKVCSSTKDTVLVYDNTKTIEVDKIYNLECNKKIKLVAKTLAFDVNSSSLDRKEGIILINYTEKQGRYCFYFINIADNSSLRLSFNRKGRLKKYEFGVH